MNATQKQIEAIEERMTEINSRIGRCPIGDQTRYLEYLQAYDQLAREKHQFTK